MKGNGKKNKIFKDFINRWEKVDENNINNGKKDRCPFCHAEISPHQSIKTCIKCGFDFTKKVDVKDEDDLIEALSDLESDVEGGLLKQSEDNFEDGLEDEFECPECGSLAEPDAKKCLICETIFVDPEKPIKDFEDTFLNLEESLSDIGEVLNDLEKNSNHYIKETSAQKEDDKKPPQTMGDFEKDKEEHVPLQKIVLSELEELPEKLLEFFIAELETPSEDDRAEFLKKEEELDSLITKEEDLEDFSIFKGGVRLPDIGSIFSNAKEIPDNGLENSIEDLGNFIEKTTFELEINEVESRNGRVRKPEIREEEKTKGPSISISDKADIKTNESPLFPVNRRNLNLNAVDVFSEKIREREDRIRCPLCLAHVLSQEKFCIKCGMVLTLNKMEEKGHLASFISEIQKIIKQFEKRSEKNEVGKKLEVVNKNISKNLQNDELWFQRGLLLLDLESYQKTLKSFDTVIKLNPEHKKVWIAKANVLSMQNRMEEAAECYKEAFKVIISNVIREGETQKAKNENKAKLEQWSKVLKDENASEKSIADYEERLRGVVIHLPPDVEKRKTYSINKLKIKSGLINRHPPKIKERNMNLIDSLTNEIKSKKHGLTNGLSPKVNERNRGLTNGLTNGKINGLKKKGPGITNGLINGLTNGIQIAKMGMINGLTNGLTGGMTNGLTNGFRALKIGITNGLTNGNGITNGLGGHPGLLRGKSSRGRMVLVGILITVLLFIAPNILIMTHNSPEIIEIDGTFGDWKNIETTSEVAEAAPFNPNTDIIDYKVDGRFMDISFYLKVKGNILAGEPDESKRHVDSVHIFIDTDCNSNSGYIIKGIGADYMIEIFGWDQMVIKRSLYIHEGNPLDWNNWAMMGNILCAADGSELEIKLHYSTLYLKTDVSVEVLFHTMSWDGFDDFSETVIGNKKGTLKVIQQGVGEEVLSGQNNRLLKMELEAINDDVSLNKIVATRIGKGGDLDVSLVRLEYENGDLIESADLQNGIVTFEPKILINKGQPLALYIEVDIGNDAVAENSLGFKIQNNHDLTINSGCVSINELTSLKMKNDICYILNIPGEVLIDGAFSDWKQNYIFNDDRNDVEKERIDILNFGIYNNSDLISFYLKVDGKICGGTSVPSLNAFRAGLPSQNSGSFGLNGSEIKNNDIPQTGEDSVYIFIDSDDNPDSGYHIGEIGAEHLIEVKGKEGKITSKQYFGFSGLNNCDWDWTKEGSLEAETDYFQLETQISKDLLNLNGSYKVYFQTSDWNGDNKDEAGNGITRNGEYPLSSHVTIKESRQTRGTGNVVGEGNLAPATIGWGDTTEYEMLNFSSKLPARKRTGVIPS